MKASIGRSTFAGHHIAVRQVVSAAEWEANAGRYPTADDTTYSASLMQQVTAPGAFAGWIAPPAGGIHAKPVDFEYVKLS